MTKESSPGSEPGAQLPGPLVFSFTMRLPFRLNLHDTGLGYRIPVPGKWADPIACEQFGEQSIVLLRFANIPSPLSDHEWPLRAREAIRGFYKLDLPEDVVAVEADGIYEQWISLETPNYRLEHEPEEDKAFTFHRCLNALNRYLRAHFLTYKNINVRQVSTHDFSGLIIRGAWASDGQWHFIGPMYMHPETHGADLPLECPEERVAELIQAHRELDYHPYTNSAEWFRRAQYAQMLTGDYVDMVVCLQTSIETMLYRTWGMILIDQGLAHADVIKTLNSSDSHFKSLLTKHLPRLLGGRWDVTATDTPVGRYWIKLYSLRNDIVHSGKTPSPLQAKEAFDAYISLREYVNERLWVKHKNFPRTLLIKLGDGGLERHGWDTKWMREFADRAKAEPRPFFLAYDVAGREKP